MLSHLGDCVNLGKAFTSQLKATCVQCNAALWYILQYLKQSNSLSIHETLKQAS